MAKLIASDAFKAHLSSLWIYKV